MGWNSSSWGTPTSTPGRLLRPHQPSVRAARDLRLCCANCVIARTAYTMIRAGSFETMWDYFTRLLSVVQA
jgi:hypothetical protein